MALTTLPGVPYGPTPRAASHTTHLTYPPRMVVIHDTGNTANATNEAHYAATRDDPQQNWTSAHFYIDEGGPLGSLHLDLQAWAAFAYANSHGWHLEMCGMNAGTAHAVPRGTIAHTANLTRRLCQEASIPMRHLSPHDVAAGRSGICGHYDITRSGIDGNTHTDPGPDFGWDSFIEQVQEDDMPYRTSLGAGRQDLPWGEHTVIRWPDELRDVAHTHANGNHPGYIAPATSWADFDAMVQINGARLGDQAQMRLVVHDWAHDQATSTWAEVIADEPVTSGDHYLRGTASKSLHEGQHAYIDVVVWARGDDAEHGVRDADAPRVVDGRCTVRQDR